MTDVNGDLIEIGSRVQYTGLDFTITEEGPPGDTYIIIGVRPDTGSRWVNIESESTNRLYCVAASSCTLIPKDPCKFIKVLPV